jgi:hypothetical protein
VNNAVGTGGFMQGCVYLDKCSISALALNVQFTLTKYISNKFQSLVTQIGAQILFLFTRVTDF